MIPTGTITFLFTDIEGSTKLWQEYPDQMKANLARHDTILRSAIEQNDGYVFKTVGDAFCAAFPTAIQGVKAAIEAQKALSAETWGECVIKVRMGLHTGDAEERDNDYFGNTVNRIARLSSAGHGGQILLSLATQELVSGSLPEGTSLKDMGEHRLKDLVHPEHIYQLNIPNLPLDFPALKTLDAQLNNLPAQTTHFIGREREINAVLGLLRNPSVRLVTLTGPGGTGKTRLSLQVAADMLDEFKDGVWFVELASITSPELFLPAVATALRVKYPATVTPAVALNDFLRERHLLIVMDNFEQLVGAAPQISGLLSAAPKIKVLVSSREILRLRGEHDYPVPPLGLPESRRYQSAAVLAQYEAVSLFVQHAQAVNPAFELNDDNAQAVAEICLKLDGLPLAIELAAARSRMLKPAVMLEKLKNKLDVLTGGARDLPRRQQTIRGAIDWSYDLLDEAEKKLFSRLGIFVGGWTLDAAEAVCGSGLGVDSLSGLESLLDKSLIRQYESSTGEMRFAMLETIREYAFEKLSQGGELPDIQQAHADYMDGFLQRVISSLHGPQHSAWFNKLDNEMDNLRGAMTWTLARQQPGLAFKAGRLFRYWDERVNLREPMDWMERSLKLEHPGEPAERALVLLSMSAFLTDAGYGVKDNLRRSREYSGSALALYREIGDQDGIARCLNSLGNITWREKEIEKARQLFKEALSIFPDQSSWYYVVALINLGCVEIIRGDYVEARAVLMRGQEICIQIDSELGVAFTNWKLCILALAERRLEEALGHIQKMLSTHWAKSTSSIVQRAFHGYVGYIQLLMGDETAARPVLRDALEASLINFEETSIMPGEQGDFWFVFDGAARLALLDGQFERAALLFGAAWAQREEAVLPPTEAERPDYEARIAEVRAGMGSATFDTAFDKGKAMSLKDALVFATQKI